NRFVELFSAHLSQPFESRVHQLLPRLKVSGLRNRHLPVPGADILADVASEDMASDAVAQLLIFRKRAALLNREIRDALIRIELVRRNERVRGTSLDASRATAAAIRRRQTRFVIEF